MSKERELLKQVVENFAYVQDMHLIVAIQKLLNQPEQTEQEPEAWIVVNKETGYRTQVSDLTPFLYNREIFEVIPLYTAPPKREPLSDEEIYNHCCAMDSSYTCNFIDGVEWAEEHHGIGGGE
jgi:hypothetical protein